MSVRVPIYRRPAISSGDGEMIYVHMMGKSRPKGLMSMLLIRRSTASKLEVDEMFERDCAPSRPIAHASGVLA